MSQEVETSDEIKFNHVTLQKAYSRACGRALVFAAARTELAELAKETGAVADTCVECANAETLNKARARYEIAKDDYAFAVAHFGAVVGQVTQDLDDDDLENVLDAISSVLDIALGAE
jgi:hypothetical protein